MKQHSECCLVCWDRSQEPAGVSSNVLFSYSHEWERGDLLQEFTGFCSPVSQSFFHAPLAAQVNCSPEPLADPPVCVNLKGIGKKTPILCEKNDIQGCVVGLNRARV